MLLTCERGYACIFPQDADLRIWIPDRFVMSQFPRHQIRGAHTRSLAAPQPALTSVPPATPRTLLTTPRDLEPKKFVRGVRARKESVPMECSPDQHGPAGEKKTPRAQAVASPSPRPLPLCLP